MSRKLAKDLALEGTTALPVDVVFLRLADVMRVTGLCRSVVYELMLAGLFPRPVKIGFGKSVGWISSEVLTWQVARIAARDAAPKVAPQVRRRHAAARDDGRAARPPKPATPAPGDSGTT